MTLTQPPAEGFPGALPEQDPSVVVSVFPFGLEDVTEMHRVLADPPQLSMQRGIVELREKGRAGDMLTTLYAARFDAWHIDNGRMPADSPEDVTAYKVAQLYGLRMASDRYHRLTDERVRADSPEAYDAACAAVFNSYAVRPAPHPLNDWEIETWRESVHGEDSLLSATLGFTYDKLIEHYGQLFDERMSIPEDRIYNALYRGMLDSVIFFNTYLRAKQGLSVELFPGLEYQRIADTHSELQPGQQDYFLPEGHDVTHQMSLLPGETPGEFLIRVGWFAETVVSVGGRVFKGQRMAVQAGPNLYRVVYRVERMPDQEDTYEPGDFERSDLQRAIGLGAVASSVGFAAGGVVNSLMRGFNVENFMDGAAPSSVAGLILGAAGGVLLAARRRLRTDS